MSVILPLASNQRDVWFDQAAYYDSPVYNIGGSFCFDGEIDYKLLEKAINQLVMENDALRLVFHEENGFIVQGISGTSSISLEFIDFSDNPQPRASAQEWIRHTFRQPFLLDAKSSLSQFALLKESANCYYLMTKYHHIIADGWSTKVVIDRLADLYNAFLMECPPKAATEQHYFDFVKQEQKYLSSDAYQHDADYWLSAIPALPHPLIESRYPGLQKESLPKANIHKFTLSRSFYNGINQYAQDRQSTLYHVLLSALALYFSRTVQQDEIVIGIPCLNRNGARFKDVLGMFVSLSPLTLKVDNSGDINQLMRVCGKALREVYRHQRFPLGAICKRLELLQHKRNSLFDLVFSYERQDFSAPYGSATLKCDQLFCGVARYPLAVTICEFNDAHDVDVVLEGSELAFTVQDLEMLGNRIQLILEQMVAHPQMLVGDVDLLPAHEKHLLDTFNGPVAETQSKSTVIGQFGHQVALNPNTIAIEYLTKRLSYRQLDLLSNRFAHPLIGLGAGANKIVALCVPRSPEMIIGILAILKTTAAYLPIDPDIPAERIAEILAQSKAVALLSLSEQKNRLSPLHPHLIILDEPLDNPEIKLNAKPVGLSPAMHDLAYVIFTSGSTGRPKGVMLEHQALSIRLSWLQEAFKITSKDRIAQTIQYSFDPSIIEIFLALTQGACLVLAPPGHQTPASIAQFIVGQNINALALVPSSLRNLMLGLEMYTTSSLRVACCGGEVLPPALASEFIYKTGARLLNVYGPTETTILASAFECKGDVGPFPLPIGRPIDDTRIYIVDSQLRLLPVGVAGEIVIGGGAVARGYLNYDDLTRERFFSDPYHPEPNNRLYRTGDIGYIGPDGQLYFVGRVDNQVKISGYRIELGEIETLLASHPKVRVAAVKVFENNSQKGIYAYVEAIGPQTISAETLSTELSRLLRNKLPEYMQPRGIICISTIPIKQNGKIDYDGLPKPEQLFSNRTGRLPSSPIEMQLLQLWVDTLKTHEIGTEDNFFELGGDSLAAVTLMIKIEQLFGARFSLSLLLENPTISLLANVLAQEQASIALPLLIPLSKNNGAHLFYLAASGHGDIMRFAGLADHLDGICTLHMLQPPASSEDYLSIESIAKAYAEAILGQDEAPGYIGGFSIGGITALETARILVERGKPPKGVFLLDSVYPRWPMKSPVLFWLLRSLSKFFRLNKTVINGRYLEVMFADPGIVTQLLAVQSYQIKPFSYQPAVLFISTGMKPIKLWALAKWSDIFSVLTLHRISGSHGEIFQPPHLQVLADAIRAHIDAK